MELQELYDRIGLPEEIRERLRDVGEELDPGLVDSYVEQLTDRACAAQAYGALQEILQEDEGNFRMLYCQLESARRVHRKYAAMDIPETVYTDTMKCFIRFLGECKDKTGQMFFDRGWWTYRQTSMEIFRIGALEYQFAKYEGEDVISVHIPSDADMTDVSVERSLREAQIFFRTYYSAYAYDRYVCESWLMSPALRPLLSETSHIVQFQNRFRIVQEDKDDKEYIEWLFQVPVDTQYSRLPERTGLQRRVKEMLLGGGAVGAAVGVINL